MSKKNAKEFLKGYRNNQEAMKMMAQAPKPASEDEQIALIVETAGKLGIQFTREEMADAVREFEEEQRTRTDTLSSDLETIDDEELKQVAGGDNGRTNEECSEHYVRDTSCYYDYYCYYGYHRSPEGRTDVPCAYDYNCLVFNEFTLCERNFFSGDLVANDV